MQNLEDIKLITSKMELAGFGELMRKYELLKNKLNSEGLVLEEKRRDIPESLIMLLF